MIWNLGSINADYFYRLPHLPQPGETLAAVEHSRGLGGKGANMSVAAARAAARVAHIGAVGPDGAWAVTRLLEYGVEIQHITTVDQSTGHAIISVDDEGENSIILYPGANDAITAQMIGAALTEATPGDFLLMQNETSGQVFAGQTAKTLGLKVAYAAAPFNADAVMAVVENCDVLILNAVEAAQLEQATSKTLDMLPVADIVVTLGAQGCKWISKQGREERRFAAYLVDPVDTTGAGDTFTGYLVAGLDRGMPMEEAIDLSLKAAAIMVTRDGTADVIPDLKDIQDHDFSAY